MSFNTFLSTALVACASFGAGPGGLSQANARAIVGAGAASPLSIYSKLAEACKNETGAGPDYQSIGPGGGIKQFGATDAMALKGVACWTEGKDKPDASGLLLSGVQQHRQCIARTIVIGAEVILFDEPGSASNPSATAKIGQLIDELKSLYTIFIVTHNMQQIAHIPDHTVLMYPGELIEFYATPRMFTSLAQQRAQDYITGRFG
jgi:ABC-type phosphate transport system ATPase subunit